MPKNAQTTEQLHSSYTLAKEYSKFSKPGFSNTWTVNFHMFKLHLEEAERNQKSNSQHLLDHGKSKRVPEKHLLYWLCQSLWLCGSQQTVKFFKRWEHLTCLLRNLYAGQEATVRTGCGTTDWFQIGKGVHQGCVYCIN